MAKQFGYIAIFERKRIEIYAASLYAAKLEAVKVFKPAKSKQHMVIVELCQNSDGTPVTKIADF